MSFLDRIHRKHHAVSGCPDTPDTPRNREGYQPKALQHKGCTYDTPDTPQNGKLETKPEAEGLASRKAEQQARHQDLEELFQERAAIAEHDGGLSQEEAEELAIRTVWRWAVDTGETGTYRGAALTYDEARAELERQFRGRKVTHLEFISAIAEGFGFVAYRPEIGEAVQ